MISRAEKEAQQFVDRIKNSDDKRVMYRDIRPITDIKHMLSTSVELYGENTAFHVKDKVGGPYRTVTYHEMKADVDALGTALISHGLKDKRIGIIGENGYGWAISYLATVCGTGIVVPLDRELSGAELSQLVTEADVQCVLFTKKFKDQFCNMRGEGKTPLRVLINIDGEEEEDIFSLSALIEEGRELLKSGNRTFVDAEIDRETMGILLFTSGTTGIAKGVMLSHKNIASDLMASPTLLQVTVEDVFFSVLPIHHTYECTCGFLMPLYRGASIAYCEGLKYLVKNLAQARPTIFLAVPLIVESLYKRIWQNVKKSGKEKLLRRVIGINRKTKRIGIDLGRLFFRQITDLFGGRMKVIICGGAAIDADILQGIRDFGINALQGYGLTECAPICALNPDRYQKNASAGYIPPGFDIKIENKDPETGIGEICVKGDNIMLGYYNNPSATEVVLRDGWFHTGDLGYLDDDRYVYITGRIKNVIITKNGKNVYPEELEHYLNKSPLVEECLVYGRDGEESGETLIVASIRIEDAEVKERLGTDDYTRGAVEGLLWQEVDRINEEQPFFKRIKKIEIREEEFHKTTGKKIKRFDESNISAVGKGKHV